MADEKLNGDLAEDWPNQGKQFRRQEAVRKAIEAGERALLDHANGDNDELFIVTVETSIGWLDKATATMRTEANVRELMTEVKDKIEASIMGTECPECGKGGVAEEIREYEFPYGIDGPNQVMIKVKHPMLVCLHCGFGTFDSRGEEARATAVQQYLESKP